MLERSLQVLLHEIVDYAGLFPPAGLDLDPALRNFSRYGQALDVWALGRFVCPTARFAMLPPLADLFSDAAPLRLSVLPGGGPTESAFFDQLAQDVADIQSLAAAMGKRVAFDAFEVRLPASALGSGMPESLTAFLTKFARQIDTIDGLKRPCFFEIPVANWPEAAAWSQTVAAVARVLGEFNERLPADAPRVGFKLRTGGLEASAFPSTMQVTEAILACVRERVPMKFTAGLHHPIRRYDSNVRTQMHGFINVFLAAILAYSLRLGRHDVLAILDETDPANFHFGAAFCGWDQADATIGEVQWARQNVAVSFGSCSFDEPLDDLRALGWL